MVQGKNQKKKIIKKFFSRFNGKKYRYFYAITSDVDDSESAGKIYKVDVESGEVKKWAEEDAYCAEPMFVQR